MDEGQCCVKSIRLIKETPFVNELYCKNLRMVKDAEHERILIMDEPRLRSIPRMPKKFAHATYLVNIRKMKETNFHSLKKRVDNLHPKTLL